MTDLLRWFHNLEFAERSSVTAVVDDGNFLSFYMNLLRDEYQQPNDDKNHALFMADYLTAMFERAKKGKSSSSTNEFSFEIQESSSSTAGTDGLVNESTLLSFLKTGRTSGNDTSDFDDPYILSFCSDLGVLKTDGDTNLSAISPRVPAVEYLKCLGSERTQIPFVRNEIQETMARRQGVQSAISNLMNTAVLNVANKLGNQRQIDVADRIQKIDENRTLQQTNTVSAGAKTEIDHFAVAANLHSTISVSFATSGTDSFDCLFLMRPHTEDSNHLIEKFLLLSRGQMFSHRPTPQYVKAALSGKSLPMMSWLADYLSPPFNSTRSCAVPYYMLLLSRIELAMWSAFFSVCENKGNQAASALSGIDAEFDGEVGNFSNIALLPRSVRQNGKNSTPVAVAPVRNSLRVLERSTLYRLSCTAVMLSLGCISEEWKAAWRVLPTADLLKIVSEHPRLNVFYSNPSNVRGRSETIVDRLVLCPLAWVMDLADERRAKCTYRRLEAAISSISAGNNSSYNGDHIHSSSDALTGTSELRLTEKSRAGLVKFDESAKRTGAIPHTSGRTQPEIEVVAAVPSDVASEAVKGLVVRPVVRPEEGAARHRGSALGLTKRTVTRPPPGITPPPPLPLPIPPAATYCALESGVVEIAKENYGSRLGVPPLSLSSAVSENSNERPETYSGSCDENLPASKSKKAKKAKQKAAALLMKAVDADREVVHCSVGASQSGGDLDSWDASSGGRDNGTSAHISSSTYRSYDTAFATNPDIRYSISHLNGHAHLAEVPGPPSSGVVRGAPFMGNTVVPGHLSHSKATLSNCNAHAPPHLKNTHSITCPGDSQVHSTSNVSRRNVPLSNSPRDVPLRDSVPVSGDVRGGVVSSSYQYQYQHQCDSMVGPNDGPVRGTGTELRDQREREQDRGLEDHSLSSAGEGDMSARQRAETSSPKVDRGKKSIPKPLQRIVPSDGLGTACSTERIRCPLHSPRGPGSGAGAEGRFQDNSAAPPARNKTPDEELHLAVSFPTSPSSSSSSSSSFKSLNSYEVSGEGGRHLDPVRFEGGKHGDPVRFEVALQISPQLLSSALKGPHPPYPSPSSPRHSGSAGDDRPHPGPGPGTVIVSPPAPEWGKQGSIFVRPPDSWGPTGQYASGDCRTPVRTMSLGREPMDSGNRSQRPTNIDVPPGFQTFSPYSPHGYTGSHERSEAPHTYTDSHRYHHNGGNSDASSHNGNNNLNMYNKCDNLGNIVNNGSNGSNRGYGDYSFNSQTQGHSDMAPSNDYRMIDSLGYSNDSNNHNNHSSNQGSIQSSNSDGGYNTISNFNYINNLNSIQNNSNSNGAGMNRERDRERDRDRDVPPSQTQSSSSSMLKARNLLRSAPYREIAPKVSKEATMRQRAAVRLHKSVTKNIRSFNNIMSGRMEVHKLTRIALYLELRSMVTSLWPSAAVHIFGSCITGLALPSSDIDIVIQLTRQPCLRLYQLQPQPQTQPPFQYSPQRSLYYQDPRPLSPGQYFQYPHSPHNLRPHPRTPTHMPPGPDEWGETPKGGRARVRAQTLAHPGEPAAQHFEGDSHRPEVSETAARSPARIGSTDSGNLDPGIQTHPVPQLVYPSPSPFAREKTSPTPLSPTLSRSPRSPAPPVDFPSPGHYIPGMGLPQPPAGPTPEMFNSLFFALTSQLHMQVWASQVNPIPSATVPVIKLRVAADALLSNPAMQQAVFAAHQQQMLSPILEPTMFTLPMMQGQEYGSSPMHYPSSFPSISSSGLVSRESSGSLGGIPRDRALSAFEEHSADRASYPRQNGGTDPEQQRAGQTALGLEHFNGNSYQPQQMQQMQQQQQQFSYPPQTAPFSGPTPHSIRPVDHGHSVLGGAGPYPSQFSTTPFFAMLPFHLAAGVGIAVDITIENGQHKGLSTCEFVQQSLSTRSAVLPAVVKVVKALLVQSKLNVPFLGGLSSYSAFLLVLAAYDRCQNSDARNAFVNRGKGLPSSPSGSNLYSDGDGFNGGSAGGSIGIGGGAGSSLPVTEGEVFMHFLALFASSSQGFNSACQGIDVRCEPYMLSDLTPDQQVTIIGGGLWIVDPLDSTKNVARPSFAFRHAQQYFRQCLDKIEGAAAGTALSGPDAQAFDFLKLLMRF